MSEQIWEKIEEIRTWIDDRSSREQAIILLLVLVAAWWTADTVLLKPLAKEHKSTNQELNKYPEKIATAKQEGELLQQALESDPNFKLKQRQEQLQTQIEDLDLKLDDATRDLISPDHMVQLLKDVLAREKDLQLMRVESGTASHLFAEVDREPLPGEMPAEAITRPKTTAVPVYKHPLEIEFEGTYLATLRYLQSLENLPWRIFWDGMDYSVIEYPRARVILHIYTLSTQEGWIGV